MEDILDLFDNYLAEIGISSNTRKNYRVDVRSFLQCLPRDLQNKSGLSQIDQDKVDSYLADLQNQALEVSTRTRKIAGLKKFFNFCSVKGLISKSQFLALAFNQEDSDLQTIDQVLVEFERHLSKLGISQQSRKNYISDVRQFLNWGQMTI